MSEPQVRPVREHEWAALRAAMMETFGEELDSDPDGERRMRALLDPTRVWAAFDGDDVVATAGSHALSIGVPGGALPVAGLTIVTVRPTHRRRGILTQLMATYLADARARGVAVGGLWASEAAIYGRFGFGIAAECDRLELDRRGVAIRMPASAPADPCRFVDEAHARATLPALYARAIAARPGVLHRSPVWWTERRFVEHALARGGASRRRHAIATRAGEPVGYVAFRHRPAGDGGTVEVIELIAIDAVAEASLWHLVLGIDLFPHVTWGLAPTDCVLPWLVDDPRRVRRARVDTLWLRLEDPAAALAARRYAHDGAVALALVDDGAPHAGAWRLRVDGGAATLAPIARAAAEVVLDRAALSSIFLGGVRADTLARAGRIAGDPAAIATLDRVMAWPVAPWCPEVF